MLSGPVTVGTGGNGGASDGSVRVVVSLGRGGGAGEGDTVGGVGGEHAIVPPSTSRKGQARIPRTIGGCTVREKRRRPTTASCCNGQLITASRKGRAAIGSPLSARRYDPPSPSIGTPFLARYSSRRG